MSTAVLALAVAGYGMLGSADVTDSVPVTSVILVALVAVAARATAAVRIRDTGHGVAWTDAAILVSLTFAPLPWVLFATAAGVLIARALARSTPLKVSFAVAKETLSAAAAGLSLIALGVGVPAPSPLRNLGALAVAYAAAALVDEALAIPVIALASHTSVKRRFVENWDIRLASLVARFVVVACTLAILQNDRRLLAVVPVLVLSLHHAYASRLRARTEREAWQRLSQATDELNDVDTDAVLATAVARAAQLFSAAEAEVELNREGGTPRLVRGSLAGASYDGDPDGAPATSGVEVTTRLEAHDRRTQVGVLRLRFPGPVKLSERERYTLRTFAAALTTATQNAAAYAELEDAARESAHAAAHDSLTGLANRRYLLDEGARLLGRRPTKGIAALLLLDLNHFKEVNDTLGHDAGDRVLCEIADRLRSCAGEAALVSRLGGDEFAVLFTGLRAPAIAGQRAEQVLTTLHEPIELNRMRIRVEASGGVATAPSHGGMPELLRRADIAMYQAKRGSRRVVSYSRVHDTADLTRLALGGDLPRAVAEDEFTLSFQPIVDLATGEAVAAEALARWQHPDRGKLDPRRFLDSVERSGLLPAFTDAVLSQALVAARDWRDAGFDMPVAVNVSPRSLLDDRFPAAVLGRLDGCGLPSNRLILELTETLTLSQLEVVDRVLGELRAAGVRLALDDFGTGFSSLSVLSRIPVHELKIDRTFVADMGTSAEAAAVVRSTVDLGRSLDLVVVAEGVEDEVQRRTLWALGCAAGQGHLFARPMPADRLLEMLHIGCEGRPGALAPVLHTAASVVRMPDARRTARSGTEATTGVDSDGDGRGRLPHWPA